MRITNSSMISGYLRDLQNNLSNMDKLNNQINTQKQVNKVSDDPFKAIKIMNMENEIDSVEKYNSNCDEVIGWLDTTDGSLGQIGSLTSDIKTLLTSIQGTFGKDEIKAVQTEIIEKIKQIGEAMNTTYAGKYVFGGSATDTLPVEVKQEEDGSLSISINKDEKIKDKLKVEISDGITLDYNLTINNINKNGLDILKKVVEKLDDSPLDTEDMNEVKSLSSDVDNYLSDILNNRALVGAKTNTVEAIKESNEDQILEMQKTYSLMQDVDVAEKFIQLKSAEMVYTSSLQVGAKLIQPTLLDYLG